MFYLNTRKKNVVKKHKIYLYEISVYMLNFKLLKRLVLFLYLYEIKQIKCNNALKNYELFFMIGITLDFNLKFLL